MRRLQFLRRGGGEGGYTLIELLVVMVILTTILTAITSLYISGANAEVQASRRFEAQQEARMAVERLRRELHCASAITPAGASAVASVTVTLPAACPSPDTSIVWSTELVSSGRYRLKRGSIMVADYLTSANVFTYTAPSTAALGKLHVSFPVNVHPSGGSPTWTLVDDIVLRNTTRA